jgi:hypothetical protein
MILSGLYNPQRIVPTSIHVPNRAASAPKGILPSMHFEKLFRAVCMCTGHWSSLAISHFFTSHRCSTSSLITPLRGDSISCISFDVSFMHASDLLTSFFYCAPLSDGLAIVLFCCPIAVISFRTSASAFHSACLDVVLFFSTRTLEHPCHALTTLQNQATALKLTIQQSRLASGLCVYAAVSDSVLGMHDFGAALCFGCYNWKEP